MAILSVSRRTDIPTFYGEWFIKRLRDGYFYTRNPYSQKLSKATFEKGDIDCIVFWTKNPASIMKYMPEIREYPHYFQFTLTGYGKDFETNIPDKKRILDSFRELSVNGSHIIWRYDPIAFTDTYTPEWHLATFKSFATQLKGYTDRCVISFVDLYTHMQNITDPLGRAGFDLNTFCKEIVDTAGENGMTVYTCAEIIDLSYCDIKKGRCIDSDYIQKITGKIIELGKDKGQRKECGCIESVEMGTYNTCLNGCKYCYANTDKDLTATCMRRYNPDSPILCDTIHDGETYTEKRLKAYGHDPYPEQLSLFDMIK